MWSRLSADHHHRRCPLDWKKQANSERPRALIKSNPHCTTVAADFADKFTKQRARKRFENLALMSLRELVCSDSESFLDNSISSKNYQRLSSLSKVKCIANSGSAACSALSALMETATGKSFHICFLLCTDPPTKVQTYNNNRKYKFC
jgi:hypothetical protein